MWHRCYYTTAVRSVSRIVNTALFIWISLKHGILIMSFCSEYDEKMSICSEYLNIKNAKKVFWLLFWPDGLLLLKTLHWLLKCISITSTSKVSLILNAQLNFILRQFLLFYKWNLLGKVFYIVFNYFILYRSD